MKLGFRLAALGALLATFACDQSGTTVRLDIDAPGVTLTSLSLDASLMTGPHQHKDLAAKVPVEVLLLLPDVATLVTVTVSGADNAGHAFTLTKTITSVVHGQVELSFALGPNAPLPDGGVDLAVDGFNYDLPPSELTLLAGAVGGHGDADGQLDRARLFSPEGLALSGNTLYIVEGQSGRLRTLDITTNTVASVPLTDALTGNPFTFSFAVGVVYDGAGALYVSSVYDDAIRKIAVATGKMTLVAGAPTGMGSADGAGPAASFWAPEGLALDAQGNLWVADSNNATIRKIALASGNTVSTPAGVAGMFGFVDGAGNGATAGPARFSSPNGLTFYNGDLYVTDGNNQPNNAANNRALRKVVITSNPVQVSTIVGTAGSTPTDGQGALATAGFGNPYGVVSDGTGTFYVADQGDNHVRRVVTGAGGMVSVLAGSGTGASGWQDATIGLQALFNNPLFLAIDASHQNVWVSDVAVIRKVSLAGQNAVGTVAGMQPNAGEVQGTGPAARFAGPLGVEFDGTDTLYVADRDGWTVRKVTLSTGAVQLVAGGQSLPESTDGQDGNSSFGYPAHLTLDAAANTLYVADSDTHLLRKVVMAGGHATVTTVAGQRNVTGNTNGAGTTMALLNSPWGVAFDGNRTVYIADGGNNLIRAFDTMSGMVSTVAGSGNPGDKNDVGTLAEFRSPRGLLYDRARNILYVSEFWGQCVRQVQFPGAAVSNVVGQAATPGHTDGTVVNATFLYPDGLALDPTGRVLYIADEGNDLVRRFDLNNMMVDTLAGEWNQEATTPGPLPARVHQPSGVAWTPLGLVVTSTAESSLLLIR